MKASFAAGDAWPNRNADPSLEAEDGAPICLEGVRKRVLETARSRLAITAIFFILMFAVTVGRLVELSVMGAEAGPRVSRHASAQMAGRADITDRNGVILATSLPSASLYADPKQIMDPVKAAAALTRIFPDIDRAQLVERLTAPTRFEWIHRHLTPSEQQAVNALGMPGLSFKDDYRRIYPHNQMAAHVVGLTDVDGHGIAGAELEFDESLKKGQPLRLSIDVRLQHIVTEELLAAKDEFRALGAAAVVLDADTGEVAALVSLPDFDPNAPAATPADNRFNRVTKGVFEMGSTFKLFTIATALEAGVTTIRGGYDASKPLHVAHYTISDYHPEKRWLSVPEILVHSSNIGAAQMALDIGTPLQRQYLSRLGLLRPASVELPELGIPLTPSPWREINTMTVSYGHGIAVTPIQLAAAAGAVVDGGVLRQPTLIAHDEPSAGERVFSSQTSRLMRTMMRQVVRDGTGTKGDVPGYLVGGKTGTSEKLVDGRYVHDKRVSSFVGSFPMDHPRYVIFALLDEPKGDRSTFNFATGGWVAAPLVARVIRRMAPLYGLAPRENIDDRLDERLPTRQKPDVLATHRGGTGAKLQGRQLAAN
ncbi:MAG: penicillin-binding protein 2 [Rhodospirillales bacterium]|nr:penicillin-binding protein 2 [Rhodospirillales bacterium]